MAMSSILSNIVIRDSKKAEAFANAFEASSRDPKWKPSAPVMPVMTDIDAIRKLMEKRITENEWICSCEYSGLLIWSAKQNRSFLIFTRMRIIVLDRLENDFRRMRM